MNRAKSLMLVWALFVVFGFLTNTAAATNLISNPGFENGQQSWSLWQTLSGTTFTIDTQIFKEGAKSAKLTATNSGNSGAIYVYADSVSAQKNYHVRFWYKTQNVQFASNGAVKFTLSCNKQGGGNGSAGIQSFSVPIPQPNTDWALFETEVTTAPETVLCQFVVSLDYAVGTLWVDDVVMDAVPNLIPNPGFEEGQQLWDLWQTSSGTTFAIDTQIFKEGVKSAKLTATNSGNLGALYIYSDPVLAQKNYYVRFWYKTQNVLFASNGAAKFTLSYNNGGGNGSAGSQSFSIPVTQQNTDWTLFETEVTTNPGTVSCQFIISLEYATGTLWVDDIVMETETVSLHPFAVTRTSPTYNECLTSQPGNYIVSDYLSFMAGMGNHSQARQNWYNANPGTWIQEQDKYFYEIWQAGMRSGPSFPWVTDNLGQTRLGQYNANYGIKYPLDIYSSWQDQQAISNGAIYTDGHSVAPFDPALELAVSSFATDWFNINQNMAPYINIIQGVDEPMNGFAIFSPAINNGASHQAMLTGVNTDIINNYGFGLWDPCQIPADPVNDPFKRIATYRWWNSKFVTHLQNEQTLADSLAPDNDYVAFSHNYVAEIDNIDIAATCAYGDWASADPYPTATLYYYGQPRCVYHTGFSTKLLCDLSGGEKNTRIHTQCFNYYGRSPQPADIREWTSQALKNGAKWISFYAEGPAKVTLSAHNAPYDGPYKEALRVSNIISSMNEIALPQTTQTNILFSNQSKWGNNDSALHSYYTVYSMLGEKTGSWFRFISDTQVDTGAVNLNNVIPNPGFEEGQQLWDLWQTSSGTTFAIDNQIFKEGAKSAKLTAANSGNLGALYIYSDPVLAQKNYYVRFWYKTQNLQFASNGAVKFTLSCNNGGGNGSAGTQSFSIPVTQQNTDWTLFEAEVTTNPGTVSCQFIISLEYATGTLWVDDIVMEMKEAHNRKLIYLPQIKYLRSSLGAALYNWVQGNSGDGNRLLVVFDPEAFSYDINGTSLAATTRSNIPGGSLGTYKSGVSYINVTAAGASYFGVAANTQLPVMPLAHMTHPNAGQVLAYSITAPSGATILATYADGSTAAYVRTVGSYGGKVVYFGVQPFGNSDLAISNQGFAASWTGFFTEMAGKVSEPINLNIWKFLLPATGNDVDLSFELEPGYGE